MDNEMPADAPSPVASPAAHDEAQFVRAAAYAEAIFAARPDGMGPVSFGVGPITIELRGPVDDPSISVVAERARMLLPYSGRDMLQAAGALWALGRHMREIEIAEAEREGATAPGEGDGA